MPVKEYNGEAIRRMTQMFHPFSARAYNWLIEKNLRELAEAAEFIKTGKDTHFRWLVDSKFYELSAFANAVRGDKNAFRWLIQHKSIFWAATANASHKDKNAMEWLRQHKFIVYAELAETIVEYLHRNKDEGFSLF